MPRRFIVDLEIPPMPKKRPRVTRNGTFMPAEYVTWKEEVGVLVVNAMRLVSAEAFTGRIELDVTFHRKRMTVLILETDNERHGRADIDNLLGAVMDAMQDAGVIDNDRDVTAISGRFDTG